MCTTYRAINNITIKYRHLILRLDDLIDELYGSTIFLKIDLKSEYNQIRVKESDEWKTTLKTKFGLNERLLIPFRLTNMHSTLIKLMHHVLRPFMGKIVTVDFDDIHVYNITIHKHVHHLGVIFETLRNKTLFVNNEKLFLE